MQHISTHFSVISQPWPSEYQIHRSTCVSFKVTPSAVPHAISFNNERKYSFIWLARNIFLHVTWRFYSPLHPCNDCALGRPSLNVKHMICHSFYDESIMKNRPQICGFLTLILYQRAVHVSEQVSKLLSFLFRFAYKLQPCFSAFKNRRLANLSSFLSEKDQSLCISLFVIRFKFLFSWLSSLILALLFTLLSFSILTKHLLTHCARTV